MATLTVDAGGGGDYTTIQAGVNALGGVNTRLVINAGTYAEQVDISSLAGTEGSEYTIQPSGAVIIDGADTRDHCITTDTGCAHIIIDGLNADGNTLTLQRALVSHFKDQGDAITFRNCRVTDGDGDSVVQGLALQGTNGTIKGNTIDNMAEHGIYLQTTNSGYTIEGNILEDNTLDGLRALGSNITIRNNTIRDNGRHGISIWADLPYVAVGIVIDGNSISNNTSTNLAIFAIVGINPPTNVYILNNTIDGASSQYNLAVIGIQPTTAGKILYTDALGLAARISAGYVDENWANRNTISAAAANDDIPPVFDRVLVG